MRHPMGLLALLLAASLLVGCRKAVDGGAEGVREKTRDDGAGGARKKAPAPPQPDPLKERQRQAAAAAEKQLKEIHRRHKEEYAIIHVAFPPGQEKKYNDPKLHEIFKPLLDDQHNSEITSFGGPVLKVRISPVKDVEPMLKKMRFGKVLAFDPAKRTVLVEYGAPTPPEHRWADGVFLQRYLDTRDLLAFARVSNARLAKHFGPDQVVTIRVTGLANGAEMSTVLKRLKKLLDEPVKPDVRFWTVDVRGGYQTSLAPVKDVAAFVKRIDFGRVLHADPKLRVVFLDAKAGDVKKGVP